MLILYRLLTFIIYYICAPYTFGMALLGSIKWRQRLSVDKIKISRDLPLIWLHASSMGEVSVVSILVKHIRQMDENISIFVTTMTDSGYDRAGKELKEIAGVSYFPLDYYSPIKRFLNRIGPDIAVFIETEIWPNMIMSLKKRNIPIVLANGRLSEKSFRSYSHFKSTMKKLMNSYSRIMVQSEDNKQRFIALGADVSKTDVMGSLKFNAPVRVLSKAEKQSTRDKLPFKGSSRVWICGSSRSGEHKQLLDAYTGLKDDFPDLKLILVPRHLDKIDEIKNKIEKLILNYVCYSNLQKQSENVDVLLVDKIGCLNELYPIADIAFVGGTLVPIGGHNILEPVWAGVPVLYGPYLDNVKDGTDYVEKNNYGRMCRDDSEVKSVLGSFLNGKTVFNIIDDSHNESLAAARTAQTILSLVSK